MQSARNLVVLRAGDASLHPRWCSPAAGFDLAISYFGRDDAKTFPEARYVHRLKAGKWDGLHDFFRTHPETLEAYDFFWLPDDDLDAGPDDIDRMFEKMREYKLELAQPTLTADSYFSHLITIQNPEFKIRYVNFIEVMAPILSASMLRRSLPMFAETRSGFGIDFAWTTLMDQPYRRSAMLDEIAIVHTRPVGGALHVASAALGVSAMSELSGRLRDSDLKGAARINGVAVPRTYAYGGITKDGRDLASAPATAIAQARGYFRQRRSMRQPIRLIDIARHVAKHAIGASPSRASPREVRHEQTRAQGVRQP